MVHVAPNAPEGRRVHGAGHAPDVCPACAEMAPRSKPRSTNAVRVHRDPEDVDEAMRDWLRRIDRR